MRCLYYSIDASRVAVVRQAHDQAVYAIVWLGIRVIVRTFWENGYNERYNGTLRRVILNAEWLVSTR